MDLFYDTYEQEIDDVRDYTNKISDLMKIDPDLHAPPPLKFIWGMENRTIYMCAGNLSKKVYNVYSRRIFL